MARSSVNNVPQLLLTVEEAADRLRICRSNMYKLISSGEVDSIQIGRLRRVTPSALEDYVRRLTSGNGKAA
jgi:excisionase family DNA binding protein